ncbi:MAG: glycosyltransferase family 39 protein [Planctomycetota bacterium]|jgi:hypothetical protein
MEKVMHKVGKQLLSFIEQKNNSILTVLISAVILSGIVYSVSLGNNLRYADEHNYYKLATNIAASCQYSFDCKQPTAYRPPGYPLILSLFVLIGANIVHLRILNFVALGLCIYLLHKILKTQCSLFAATVGAVLIVCYPVLFYTAGTLYPQTVASLLFLLVVFLLMQNVKSYRTFLLSGLLFGYLILTIPVFVFILLMFAVWFYFFGKSSIKVKGISATIVTALLVVSVWCARNYAVFNTFVFVSSNSGYMLLVGNSENTTLNAGPTVNISEYEQEADQLKLNQVQQDAYYRSKAIDWILGHRMKALKLYSLKFLNHFNYRNELATKTETSSLKDFIMLVTYGPLLLLFLTRVCLMAVFKPSPFEALLTICYFSSGLLYALFFTRIRYRLPFDFLLIAVVAVFLHTVFCSWLAKYDTAVSMPQLTAR